jgi:hypothetical protein
MTKLKFLEELEKFNKEALECQRNALNVEVKDIPLIIYLKNNNLLKAPVKEYALAYESIFFKLKKLQNKCVELQVLKPYIHCVNKVCTVYNPDELYYTEECITVAIDAICAVQPVKADIKRYREKSIRPEDVAVTESIKRFVQRDKDGNAIIDFSTIFT